VLKERSAQESFTDHRLRGDPKIEFSENYGK
jgi:hypothetical protein